MSRPKILVLSSLFPRKERPFAGTFVKERMFRLGKHLPVTVISPVPWFPLQSLFRMIKPGYRLGACKTEIQQGVQVHFPRFLALPGIGRCFDGFFMALSCYFLVRKWDFDIIDAHFSYPEGSAASWLAKWCHKPFSITLRGTEVPHSQEVVRRNQLISSWDQASHIFSVSTSLKQLAVRLGAERQKISVVGNGVDCQSFYPVEREQTRAGLGIKEQDQVLITVAGLVPRKGFHRVINLLPQLPANVKYLIVGGESAEGDYSEVLRDLVKRLSLRDRVLFLGPTEKAKLKPLLSAADLFVLASSNEGWANVILESMACATPVLASDVGGNKEVICQPELGAIFPLDDEHALLEGVKRCLEKNWSAQPLLQYAAENSWDHRIKQLKSRFIYMHQSNQQPLPGLASEGKNERP